MTDTKINEIATSVARRYKRRCWWVDVDDLVQEGVVAIMKALASGSWDPEVGVPIEAYVWRAAAFACKNFLWNNTAPVNASSHNFKALTGLTRAPLDSIARKESTEDTFDSYANAEWRDRVRAQLADIIATTPNGDLAAAVLLEERKPREIPVDNNQIYRATAILKNRLKNNYSLYKLWKEIPR